MALNALKDQTEIVFVSGLNLHKSPEIVQEAMASDEAAGPIPIVAVFDAGIKQTLGVVPYYAMKDVNGFTQVQRALADYLGGPFNAPKMTTYEKETWKDQRGRRIEASYVTSSKENVTLRLSNGKTSTFPISRLSAESQKRVAELAGG